jgi:hypothetical protein
MLIFVGSLITKGSGFLVFAGIKMLLAIFLGIKEISSGSSS